MDYITNKRLYRLIPFGVAAVCLLGLAHFTLVANPIHPSEPDFDNPFLHGPPLRPHHPFGDDRHRPSPRPTGTQEHEPTIWSERADAVKDAFRHAYTGYVKYAGSNDELMPVTNGAVNNFNGWRLTMVDSLDTMLIMGFYQEFNEALPVLANMTFALKENTYAPFFETVIRYLGGLLSAYALSGEPILLSRADDLGSMLLPAFNTSHGLPMYAVNTVSGKTRPGWTGTDILWSEAFSCQMEYKYLAHLTGRKQYFDKVEDIMKLMYEISVPDDKFPTRWSVVTGKPSNHDFSVGAFADSAHEYLLKQYLLTDKSESRVVDLYLRDAFSILRNLLYVTPNRQLLYVTDTSGASPSHNFEHLSCFLPGLLALGAHTLPLAPRDKQLHEWAARGLAYTCWITYADSETGLGPDEMSMAPGGRRWMEVVEEWETEREGTPGEGVPGLPPGVGEVASVKGTDAPKDYRGTKPDYHLRPEAVESFYLLWRTTGDEAWRERGWAVFEAIEKETKTESGYASLRSVHSLPAKKFDEMPSFFTAETLKYLYLLFTDEELIPLDRWVFNTEAHPLPIFRWSDWEKERYGMIP